MLENGCLLFKGTLTRATTPECHNNGFMWECREFTVTWTEGLRMEKTVGTGSATINSVVYSHTQLPVNSDSESFVGTLEGLGLQ